MREDVDLPEALASIIPGLSRGNETQGSDIPYYISTQCDLVDYIIGRNGVPAGRLITIFGKEGGAKSTTTQHILAETQRMGGIAILNDAERRFSKDRAVRIGLNVDDLLFIKDRTLEAVLATMEDTVTRIRDRDSKIPVTIAIDSLAGLPPQDLVDADMNKSLPAKVARIVSQAFPRLLPQFAEKNITLIVVNQTRAHMQFDAGPRSYEVRKVMGERAAMLAENALVFWSSVMLHMQSAGVIGEDRDNPEGIEVRVRVKKNSVGPEGKHCEANVMFLNGYDRLNASLDLLTQLGVIKQISGWYDYEPLEKKFRREGFAEVLASRPELTQLLHEAPELWVTGAEAKVEEEEEFVQSDETEGA